jgi:hypothetical protein
MYFMGSSEVVCRHDSKFPYLLLLNIAEIVSISIRFQESVPLVFSNQCCVFFGPEITNELDAICICTIKRKDQRSTTTTPTITTLFLKPPRGTIGLAYLPPAQNIIGGRLCRNF